MKQNIITLLIIFFSSYLFANDGAFYAKGNQLIPINETNISVKKEILTLKNIRNKFIEVTVYYEFFNPNDAKTITVGFEAFSPSGDVNGEPKNGNHPYMRDFTVELNNKILKYDVAYVADSLYLNNNKIKTIDLKSYEGSTSGNYVDFYYVYYFQAHFKKGLNIIKHTYNYDISGSVDNKYSFEYVLTAANRWANKQIDDFTLIIDNGEFEEFNIDKTFFTNNEDWLINGIGKVFDFKANENSYSTNNASTFIIQKGALIFQKKNFKINGDLHLYAFNNFGFKVDQYVPFSYYHEYYFDEPLSDFEKKILKNLPFARRGYIFKSKDLNDYFNSLNWYIPNPNYIPDTEILNDLEIKWIEKYK